LAAGNDCAELVSRSTRLTNSSFFPVTSTHRGGVTGAGFRQHHPGVHVDQTSPPRENPVGALNSGNCVPHVLQTDFILGVRLTAAR
jgi:hypothetical protein